MSFETLLRMMSDWQTFLDKFTAQEKQGLYCDAYLSEDREITDYLAEQLGPDTPRNIKVTHKGNEFHIDFDNPIRKVTM